jgi:sulfur carrier protein ThiS adenylyltransferase
MIYWSQLNYSLILKFITHWMNIKEIRSHLSKFRVGIAGAGGLGSNCAVSLARSGVGTLVICDFDVVDSSNLNRQYYFEEQVGQMKTSALKENISKIDSAINIITFNEKLNNLNIPVFFAGCDIIVEAFDMDEMKEMLIETVQQRMEGITLIVGSGMAGWGMTELIKSRKIDETLYVCGDETTSQSDDTPLMAPRVGIVANMQANLVIDLLMKKEKNKS